MAMDHGPWTIDHGPLIQELSHELLFNFHIHTEFGDGDAIFIGFSIMRFDLLHEQVCSPSPAACYIFHILCIDDDSWWNFIHDKSIEIFDCC